MHYFFQQLINGLTLGAMYGLIAIGYSMVYGIIGMINFAHGEIYMIGAFLSIISFALLGVLGITWAPLAIFVVPRGRHAVHGSLWLDGRAASPTARFAASFRLAPLISAIGMSIFLQNYVQPHAGCERQADGPSRVGAGSRSAATPAVSSSRSATSRSSSSR